MERISRATGLAAHTDAQLMENGVELLKNAPLKPYGERSLPVF